MKQIKVMTKDELQKYRNNLQIIYNYQIQVQYYDVELKVAKY